MADIPASFNLKSGVFREQHLRSGLATMLPRVAKLRRSYLHRLIVITVCLIPIAHSNTFWWPSSDDRIVAASVCAVKWAGMAREPKASLGDIEPAREVQCAPNY